MKPTPVFDSHFHIIDPRFPLIDNQGYKPASFTCADYLRRVKGLHIVGGAVVSGSFQGFDQSYLLAALKELGPHFVGVTQLPFDTAESEIKRLHERGVRGIRFNLKRGGSEKVSFLEPFAKKVFDVAGWHIELYVDAQDLDELSPILLRLPAVSIDHLGLSKQGFAKLLSLVENGIKVKASGFGRVDFNVGDALKEIVSVNPDALMFGTDLPSTRAPRPFLEDDLTLIRESFDEKQVSKILYSNAIRFYKMSG